MAIDTFAPMGPRMVPALGDAKTKTWSRADYPPITGHIEFGKVHVVRVFANGRCDVDDDRTQNLRASMVAERKLDRTQAPKHGIDRSGMSR